MNNLDPLALNPLNHSKFTPIKERPAANQAMIRKGSSMQRVIQVVHRLIQKSCRETCQLFCCPLDTLTCEKVTWCPAQKQPSMEDKTTQVALLSPPSTVLIVNISNSTLIDCVIGNDTRLSTVAESQPLKQESELHDQTGCSCRHGQQGAAQTQTPPTHPPPPAEPQSISIHSSHLNCVIIGDNNHMQAELADWTETEEQAECEAFAMQS